MKKLMVTVVALGMALSFAACKKDEGKGSVQTPTGAAGPQKASGDIPAPSPPPGPTPAPGPAPAPGPQRTPAR